MKAAETAVARRDAKGKWSTRKILYCNLQPLQCVLPRNKWICLLKRHLLAWKASTKTHVHTLETHENGNACNSRPHFSSVFSNEFFQMKRKCERKSNYFRRIINTVWRNSLNLMFSHGFSSSICTSFRFVGWTRTQCATFVFRQNLIEWVTATIEFLLIYKIGFYLKIRISLDEHILSRPASTTQRFHFV